MSNANQETIADIVADIRAQNQGLPEDSYALSPLVCDLLSFADRIEAAHQRDVAELKSKMNDVVCENEALRDACGTCGAKREREATSEKSSRVGNSAKMREALRQVSRVAVEMTRKTVTGESEDRKTVDEWALRLCDIVSATLAAPPRNCDVGTDEEQSRRYEELCDRHTCGSRCSASGCPMYEHDCSPFAWGQMPYEEGGTK